MEVMLSKNAQKVLKHRYLKRDKTGAPGETPSGLFRRVARAVSNAEMYWGDTVDAGHWEALYYDVLSRLLFLPNSPTLMNAGTKMGQLSACFVLPVEDTMEGIFTTLKNAALIQQSGGGTGFNFSHLRPKNDTVSVTGGLASGPVSFMKIFDAATNYIKQGGKRRGANMGILNIDHPDIEAFILCKKQPGGYSNFNISIAIPDAFMKALEKDGSWELRHPNNKTVVKTLRAKKIWNAILQSAWSSGDPGVIFLDTINADNPTPGLGQIEATNPCGEVPLLPYEACNLGSINLPKFIKRENGRNGIDWAGIERVIQIAIRFLDNVIEINNYLIPEIKSMALGNRKIGLGVMGWADMLSLLEIPYDTDEAIQLAGKLMHFLQEKSRETSVGLAKERGVFKNWEKSIYYPHQPIRNATRLSIAPTGTISIIADASSSIEPLFALAYQRQNVLDGERLASINQYFIDYLKEHNLFSEEIVEQVIKDGSAKNVTQLPPAVKNIFKTALEIKPEWHIKHQAVFQHYTDNAVSKTINLPESATIEEVGKLYKEAWQQKLKGITIFRYNSKGRQVLYAGILSKADTCKVCIE